MQHEIPVRPETFEAVNLGLQRALRCHLDDVEFDDQLKLHEYNAETGVYSGRMLTARVTHIERVTVVPAWGSTTQQVMIVSINVQHVEVREPFMRDASGRERTIAA